MNENMEKLLGLIKETNKVIENLKEETKEIEEKNTQDRQLKLERIRSELFEYADIVKELTLDDTFSITSVCPPDDRYCLEFVCYPKSNYIIDIILHYGVDRYITLNSASYAVEHISQESYLNYFLDHWNKEFFEKEFASAVSSVIENRAEKANYDYERAKKGATV